ncbi:hypothetical protein [Methanosphaera sp. WGK6]|uniref:hypothetical protein n=1 Tax=Methanosphaera sp. WGK6 TaxID=1561964 RepID=UPI00084BDD18|nr:hypothetical protein [Methanosphaera sp. WGK6]OED30074.1 hypothetical protein NL43_04980 [Methanosphaera sp. WGK6]
MIKNKLYVLKPITLENRLIYPIVELSVFTLENLFFNIDFTVVALKIRENDEIYYKNISMSKNDFKKIKN